MCLFIYAFIRCRIHLFNYLFIYFSCLFTKNIYFLSSLMVWYDTLQRYLPNSKLNVFFCCLLHAKLSECVVKIPIQSCFSFCNSFSYILFFRWRPRSIFKCPSKSVLRCVASPKQVWLWLASPLPAPDRWRLWLFGSCAFEGGLFAAFSYGLCLVSLPTWRSLCFWSRWFVNVFTCSFVRSLFSRIP